jgi:acetyltransferase-like isoleucine patch superfamily enzyme
MILSWYRKTSDISLALINIFFQRILRLNGNTPWMVHFTSHVICPKKIKIGKNVERSFARSGNCYIQGLNGITLKDNVLFGPGVKIISSNHGFTDHKIIQPEESIEVGEHTWLGANAIVLPGIKIGNNCIVGAGSVVTKSFPDNCVIAGNPAKIIRQITKQDAAQ